MNSGLGTLLTAMVTPFDERWLRRYRLSQAAGAHLIDNGSDGIVVCGTTGEGPTVSDREALDLFEAIVSEVGGSATVVANTGTYDTHHSVALTRSALATGVDAIMAVTPYYSKPPAGGHRGPLRRDRRGRRRAPGDHLQHPAAGHREPRARRAGRARRDPQRRRRQAGDVRHRPGPPDPGRDRSRALRRKRRPRRCRSRRSAAPGSSRSAPTSPGRRSAR